MKLFARAASKLTYANVVATLALFVALGGASYAAVSLPANSVTTRQIKNGTITVSDLNKKTAAKLKGQTGANGAAGASGKDGADGSAGATGPTGPSSVYDAAGNWSLDNVGPSETKLAETYPPSGWYSYLLRVSIVGSGTGTATVTCNTYRVRPGQTGSQYAVSVDVPVSGKHADGLMTGYWVVGDGDHMEVRCSKSDVSGSPAGSVKVSLQMTATDAYNQNLSEAP